LAFVELAENFPDQRVVMVHERHGFAVAQGLLELGGPDDVGEQQRHQPRAIFALEFVHLGAVV
jgi:hypothetical protein